jgi:predicted GH43/DUF377 family glycosyl hydrolase
LRWWLVVGYWLLVIGLAGCGKYRDFTLPAQPGGPSVTWKWQARAEPVLKRGERGAWDAVDVLNPSVIRQGDAYYNFFSGYDGKAWHTGLAVSGDGVTWHEEGKILSPDPGTWERGAIAANGSAATDDSGILYYYQAGEPFQIGLARSRNGHQWQRNGAPVLATGPYGSWDESGIGDPYVIRAGRGYYMFYLGMDRARRQRLGVAASDDGVAGTSCGAIRFWSWANMGHSMLRDSASRRCGQRADITGCCTRGAMPVRCGGWAWRDRATESTGRNYRW